MFRTAPYSGIIHDSCPVEKGALVPCFPMGDICEYQMTESQDRIVWPIFRFILADFNKFVDDLKFQFIQKDPV